MSECHLFIVNAVTQMYRVARVPHRPRRVERGISMVAPGISMVAPSCEVQPNAGEYAHDRDVVTGG
jgi:hypothetical protein